MLCKVIVCLLIAYRFESVHSKAWPDQYDRYNYMDPSRGWGNPYYEPRANYPAGDFGSEPTTTTTAKPIYPTLFPKYQPSAPFPEPPRAPASGGHQFENDNQRQVPVNPFEVLPLQPNVGGNRNVNQSHHNPNDYSRNNNFNYPFDNTRTPFPPFDGSTKRPTLPTRRVFGNFPPPPGAANNTVQRPLNPMNPVNPTNPPYYNGNNHQNYDPSRNDRYNPLPSSGNSGQHFNNNGSSSFRPFANPSQLNQQGNNGNGNPNQPNYQPNKGSTNPYQPNGQLNGGNQFNSGSQFNNGNQFNNNRSQLNNNNGNQQFNSGNQYPNQQNIGNPSQLNNNNGNQQFNSGNQYPNQQNIGNPSQLNNNNGNQQFNSGNQYPNQQNIGNPSQGNRPGSNINTVMTNQNSFNQASQSPAYQKPDYDPNGVALAPFPDVSSFPVNNHDGKLFTSGNLQNRQPPVQIQPDVNSRFNSNGPSQTPLAPLAGYSGAHVPLA